MAPRRFAPPTHVFADLERLQQRAGGEIWRWFPRPIPGMRGSFGRLLGVIPDEGARQTTLAEGMWITKQALGKRLRSLEEQGWIEVEPDPTDHRARIVRRTPAGDRARATTEDGIAAMEAAWAAEVGEDRYRIFREVMAELGAAAADVSRRA